MAQIVQQQLKQIGVAIELEFLPGRGLFESKGPLVQRTFEVGMWTWVSRLDPNVEALVATKNVPSQANNFQGQNYPGIKNAKMDELSSKGASLIDPKERAPIYCELQKVWSEEMAVLPLFQQPITLVQRTRLQNFRPTPGLTPETWNIYEWALA